MNTLQFPTRSKMRSFVNTVNNCLQSKTFKASGGKAENGSWMALRSKPRSLLVAPLEMDRQFKPSQFAFNESGSIVPVTIKKSRTAVLSH